MTIVQKGFPATFTSWGTLDQEAITSKNTESITTDVMDVVSKYA